MRRIDASEAPHITINFEGQPLEVRQGETVAAALLGAGHWTFCTAPLSGAARGPFCMMGVCFDCLLEIDGMANRQACMTEVLEGMQVNRQHGATP
jgi:predicted molibdopterin-dependent oxidoreductase YjgC